MVFRAAYLVTAVVHLTALLLNYLSLGDFSLVVFISKPLLMPLLMIHYLQASAQLRRPAGWALPISLIFSFGGDVLLMLGTLEALKSYMVLLFLSGLVSFLIAHVCYILEFAKDQTQGKSLLRRRPLWLIPFLLVYAAFMNFIIPNMEYAFIFPVVVYGGVLTTMVVAAFNRKGKVNALSFWLVFIGALTFYLSDSMIAIDRFYHSFQLAPLAIMTTYLTAQYLIVIGLLRRVDY
ncbi:MAG: lysoplasmalogenase [Chitinophagales bacterium]|nr:lysoplasmalogenase [Chitinophagales bacterium]